MNKLVNLLTVLPSLSHGISKSVRSRWRYIKQNAGELFLASSVKYINGMAGPGILYAPASRKLRQILFFLIVWQPHTLPRTLPTGVAKGPIISAAERKRGI
jgi:hypothetical protein